MPHFKIDVSSAFYIFIENDNSIFDTMKKKRQCKQTPASTIDGLSDDISGYLASKYGNMYNAVDDQKNLDELETHLENRFDQRSIRYVNRINPDVNPDVFKEIETG